MLKDITLGQFFPGTSLLHRLDPRAKLIAVVLFVVSLFISSSFWGYGLCILFLGACIKISGIGLGRFPGEGNGNPIQYSCLENSIDIEAWHTTVHRVTKNWT